VAKNDMLRPIVDVCDNIFQKKGYIIMHRFERLGNIKRIWGGKVAEEAKRIALEHKLNPETIDIHTCDVFDPEKTGYVSYEMGAMQTNDYEAQYHYYKPCQGWARDIVHGRYVYGDGDCSFQMMTPVCEMDMIKREYERLQSEHRLLGLALGLHYDRNEDHDIRGPYWAWFYVKLWVLQSLNPRVCYEQSFVSIKCPETVTQRINIAKVESGSNLHRNLENNAYRLLFQNLFGNSSLIRDDSYNISKKTAALREYDERYRDLEIIIQDREKALRDAELQNGLNEKEFYECVDRGIYPSDAVHSRKVSPVLYRELEKALRQRDEFAKCNTYQKLRN